MEVAIIGAGIVGLATAWKLQEAGRTVLLIDRGGVAQATSIGNAGGLRLLRRAIFIDDRDPLADGFSLV